MKAYLISEAMVHRDSGFCMQPEQLLTCDLGLAIFYFLQKQKQPKQDCPTQAKSKL